MADSPYIVEVTAENFQSVILEGSMQQPVLIDFWASWCQPCQALMPLLARLAEEYKGKFILAKINTEEQQEIAAHFQIRSIPTLMIFREKIIIFSQPGALPESAFKQLVDRAGELDMDEVRKQIAEEQRARAQVEAQTAQRTSDFIVGLFEVSDPNNEAMGNTITARELLDSGAAGRTLETLVRRSRELGDG